MKYSISNSEKIKIQEGKMFTLIKNIEVYTPEYVGEKSVLLCGDKIAQIDNEISYNLKNMKIIDGRGKKLMPGIIDQHMHITGGGGEGSFKTRVPEVMLSSLTKGGVTTVVGLLGTDSTTRSVENLVAKTKALKEEGINGYCLTGAYAYPSPSITGSIKRDITFIDEVIGVKIAFSDHRSSAITSDELARIATEARVGGLLSGKTGYVTMHMGDGNMSLDPVYEIIKKYDIPINHFRPTHVGRNEKLFNDAVKFNKNGGYIDFTAGYSKEREHICDLFQTMKNENVHLERVTLSSDGNGSWSLYDRDGKVVKIGASSCDTVFKQIVAFTENKVFDFAKALEFGTSNVAKAIGIDDSRGYVKEGYFADLIITDMENKIECVIANGDIMVKNGVPVKKGTFEDLA